MKRTVLLSALLLCCTTTYAFAGSADFSTKRTLPPKGYGESPGPVIQAGGDNFGTATVIPALPYADGGNTCSFANDFSPPCVPSTAPDVFYAFRPIVDMCVDISLCNSSYDTEIVLYANNSSTVVACQDDSDCGLQSHLANVALVAGNTYYIMIDGFGSACGDYVLEVTECPPPAVCDPCPPLAIQEGEPTCGPGYVDTFDAGCNSTPPTVRRLACDPNVTVCGTYGTFDGTSRDTDWYEFTVTAPTVLNVTVQGHGLTGTALAIIDANCPPTILCGEFTPGNGECVPTTCSAAVGPGTYRVFTASFFDGTPCGSTYVLNISGMTCPVPTATTSWGKVKGIYR